MFEHNLLMFIPPRRLRIKSFAEKKKNYPPITFFSLSKCRKVCLSSVIVARVSGVSAHGGYNVNYNSPCHVAINVTSVTHLT